MPLCRADDEVGRVGRGPRSGPPPPPANSWFGRPRGGVGVAGCTNPAALTGGPAELSPYFPVDAAISILSDLGAQDEPTPWLDPAAGTVTTPYVTLPGLLTGECVPRDGFNVLEVVVNANPADPRTDAIGGDLTPEPPPHRHEPRDGSPDRARGQPG